MKEMPDLICGKAAVGGNYNSTRDRKRPRVTKSMKATNADFTRVCKGLQGFVCRPIKLPTMKSLDK